MLGLAAPAVAAALLVLGTSTAVAAAALTSATVMSGLFGSAGMGLAGYKMIKRTRGISEFEFESEENFGSKYLLTNGEKDDVDNDKDDNKEKSENKLISMFKTKTDDEKNEEASNAEAGDCKINHLSVMICVSGWMIDKEDHKKSFGIVPHEMTDEERLRRFYQIHCPQKVDRAADDIRAWKQSACTSGTAYKVKQGHEESSSGSSLGSLKNSVTSRLGGISTAVGGGNDIDEFFDNLSDIYGADPRVVESLVPPPMYSSQTSTDELQPPPPPPPGIEVSTATSEDDMMQHILESITIALDNKKRANDKLAAKLKDEKDGLAEEMKMRVRTPSASPVKKHRKKVTASAGGAQDSDDDSIDEDVSSRPDTVGSISSALDATPTTTNFTENNDKVDVSEDNATGGDNDNEEAVVDSNDTQSRLESDFWHWNQTELSGAYELNLLRWETPMQMELGRCIQQMLKDLTEAVATKVLQATVLAALMTAVIVPYSLMRFMDKIDNIWDIATERADAAGIMLAHVLLKRPQGSRSVTLVGHSIGSRLVFSCLQELYRCKQVYLEERVAACRREAQERAHRQGIQLEKRKGKKKSFTSSMVSGMKSMFNDDDDDKEIKRDEESKSKSKDENEQHDPGLDMIDRLLSKRQADVEDFSVYDFKHADNIVQDVVLLGTLNSTSVSEEYNSF